MIETVYKKIEISKNIFLILILFVPAKELIIYVGLILLALGLFTNNLKSGGLKIEIVFIFILYLLIGATLRLILKMEINVRDFAEIFRFLPLLFIFSSRKLDGGDDSRTTSRIFFAYSLIDVSVSIAQMFHLVTDGILGTVVNLYGGEHHLSTFVLSNRATGLSVGPGQHSIILVVLFTYFLIEFYYKNFKMALVACGVTSLGVLLSQSQTGFIALILVNLLIWVLMSIYGNNRQKKKFLIHLFLFAGLGIGVLIYLWDDLQYLITLFKYGLSRSSYQKRGDKWQTIIELVLTRLEWMVIGHGKSYFGDLSSAMDNEYIYILSIYGFVPIVVAIISIIKYFFRSALNMKIMIRDSNRVYLFILIAVGMVIAWPSAFFTDPKILYLMSLAYVARLGFFNEETTTSV